MTLIRYSPAVLVLLLIAIGTASRAAGTDDWANLARYREANRALPARDSRRIVFMGDSITEGWGSQPFIHDNSHFVDRGISGQTAPQMLVRFRSDVIALKPAVVHVMAGTNDIAGNIGAESEDEIFGYIVSMVELARANRIKVILASVPPAADFPWRPGLDPAPKIRSLNARLKAYATSHAIVYADYWRVMSSNDGGMKAQYSEDGVHPNPRGYEAMRLVTQAAIARPIRAR
jgi:lysophospholipase L1-like esterase